MFDLGHNWEDESHSSLVQLYSELLINHMCGFLGTFSNHDESLLYSSLELISHRGQIRLDLLNIHSPWYFTVRL